MTNYEKQQLKMKLNQVTIEENKKNMNKIIEKERKQCYTTDSLYRTFLAGFGIKENRIKENMED